MCGGGGADQTVTQKTELDPAMRRQLYGGTAANPRGGFGGIIDMPSAGNTGATPSMPSGGGGGGGGSSYSPPTSSGGGMFNSRQGPNLNGQAGYGVGGYTGLRDMIDRGGPGASGGSYQGAGRVSDVANALLGNPPAGYAMGGQVAPQQGVASLNQGQMPLMNGQMPNLSDPMTAATLAMAVRRPEMQYGSIMAAPQMPQQRFQDGGEVQSSEMFMAGLGQEEPMRMRDERQILEQELQQLSPPEREGFFAEARRLGMFRPIELLMLAVDRRRMRRDGYADGGYIEGPGTGRSDDIDAQIYQNGVPVQEARLSDGEFVFTERAVRGAGNGDPDKGAAKMYRMMQQYERGGRV